MDEQGILKELAAFDTPTITNVVATYPKDKDLCLGLYSPWETNWYSDESLKCMYPELGRLAGLVVTCVVGPPDPNFNRLSWADVYRAIASSSLPVILAIKQDLPDHMKRKSGLSGGNMTTAMKSLGVIGVISDGPSRDIDEIRPMQIQYMLTGVTPGHGDYTVKAVNVPVSICGLDVCPGEIVHMDENGAVKFPRQYLSQVLDLSLKLQVIEIERQRKMAATHDVEQIIRIMQGFED